jgi:hypothetical protein
VHEARRMTVPGMAPCTRNPVCRISRPGNVVKRSAGLVRNEYGWRHRGEGTAQGAPDANPPVAARLTACDQTAQRAAPFSSQEQQSQASSLSRATGYRETQVKGTRSTRAWPLSGRVVLEYKANIRSIRGRSCRQLNPHQPEKETACPSR